MNKDIMKNQYEEEQLNIEHNIENAKNILAASMMAQSLSCCLEKKYLDVLSESNSLIEITNDNINQENKLIPISWLKIEQIGKPNSDGISSCFFYIQKILHSCAIPHRRLTFLIVGNEGKNHLYLGLSDMGTVGSRIISKEVDKLKSFSNACWPGLVTTKVITKDLVEQDEILQKHFNKKYDCVTAFTGIPTVSDSSNSSLTTVEQLIQGMNGQDYAYLVTADPVDSGRIDNLLMQCRELHGQLESVKSINITQSVQKNTTESTSKTDSIFESTSNTVSENTSKRDYKSVLGAGVLTAGLSLAAAYFFPPALSLLPGVTAIMQGTIESSTPLATFLGLSGMSGMQLLAGFVPTKSKGKATTESKGENHSITNGISFSKGVSDSVSKTLVNKHVEAACRQLEQYEKRYESAKSMGAWNVSCYLFTEHDNISASWQLKSLLSGEESSLEPIRSHNITHLLCKGEEDGVNGCKDSYTLKIKYKGNNAPYFEHPFGIDFSQMQTLLTTRELSAMVNFPLNSVSGIPVIEHASLAKEVVRYKLSKQKGLDFGCIFDYGLPLKNRVQLQPNSLTKHVFITGSTGSGKSETVYKLINEASSLGTKFLIIEPAKGEYKNVFGNIENVKVYGTNPRITKLLRINPFQFPIGENGIHVLEHVDRLVEIFNVCWPMYAAMPAVMKKAVLNCYEKCGWDLFDSTNKYSKDLFPTFIDLQQELVEIINNSAYSDEVKSNYMGSLLTRVESLTNGINGEIFSSVDLGDDVLFDENVIIDLSRIGSQETKSLIMGILIMRLSEYRMATTTESNSKLRHITVLEEAHNILKRTSTEISPEGSNIMGKSVEMITNAIAEMRTFGESFVIVDQSPTSVAPAAIKNTNTKIIMRLPDSNDRVITGKAASMKDNQIDEIAKLPTGVGVVYQDDWISPVLCKIDMCKNIRTPFKPVCSSKIFSNSKAIKEEILKLLLKGRVSDLIDLDTVFIVNNIHNIKIPTSLKIEIINIIDNITKGKNDIWQDEYFKTLSKIVTEVLSAQISVGQMVRKSNDFNELNILLNEFILQQTDITSENLMLAIRQCLMKQYGEKKETCKKIYNEWFNETKKLLLK